MKFNFFKQRKKATQKITDDLFPVPVDSNATPPQIYRGIQVFEPEDFCPFDEDYFAGENYEKEKRRRISDPKTNPSFYVGILLGAITVLSISGIITFLSLFSKFGSAYKKTVVPDLTKISVTDAISRIKELKEFKYTVEYQENPALPSGTVISQYPLPNTQRKLYGSKEKISIKLTVNKKSEPITLPNVIGQDARQVSLELKNAGINVQIKEAFSDTVKFGKIISSSHKGGSKIEKNSTVILTKSIGKQIRYITVPSLIGLSETEAISILKKSGFIQTDITYENSHFPKGIVIKQSVDEGASVREETKITLHVSIGKSAESANTD